LNTLKHLNTRVAIRSFMVIIKPKIIAINKKLKKRL